MKFEKKKLKNNIILIKINSFFTIQVLLTVKLTDYRINLTREVGFHNTMNEEKFLLPD